MPTWEYLLFIAGAAVALWNQIRSVSSWASSYVIVTKKLTTDTSNLLLSYLEANFKRTSKRGGVYSSWRTFVRPLDKTYRVIFQSLGAESQFYWVKARPLWYTLAKSNVEEYREPYRSRFSFIRGTLDFETVLLAATDWEDNERQGNGQRSGNSRFRIRFHYGIAAYDASSSENNVRPCKTLNANDDGVPTADVDIPMAGGRFLRWAPSDLGNPLPVATMAALSLRPELLELFEEIMFWFTSEKWYRLRGIPWRRGYAFEGPPGGGKTSYTRAVAEKLDMPCHVFDLSSMSNHDLRDAWRKMLYDTPCIVLLEDLDGVFDKRKNVITANPMSTPVTFDCLLNCMDGIERVDGVLLVVTTNHIDKLDDALVNRPGRVDRVVRFENLDAAGRLKMALRILDDAKLAEQTSVEGINDSAARFQERCFRIALARRFKEMNDSKI